MCFEIEVLCVGFRVRPNECYLLDTFWDSFLLETWDKGVILLGRKGLGLYGTFFDWVLFLVLWNAYLIMFWMGVSDISLV